jgi:hypothetical protein
MYFIRITNGCSLVAYALFFSDFEIPLHSLSILTSFFFKQYSASKIVKGLILANYRIDNIVFFVLVLGWKNNKMYLLCLKGEP